MTYPNTLTEIIYLFIIYLCIGTIHTVEFSCIDENDNPVDWYYVYKLPDIGDTNNKLLSEGEGYAYMTSKSHKGWTLSKKSIGDKDSMLGLTLAPLYETKKKDILYILYNDQTPKTTKAAGHSKGVVIAGEDGGLWMIHSTPKFAPIPTGKTKFGFVKTGLRNGQNFLCITLKPKQLEIAGSQMMYNDLTVYATSVPKDLADKYPTLAEVADGVRIKSDSLNSVRNIESAGGTTFRVFSKRGKYGKELYTDFVAPDLKVNLIVQTWPNSRSHQKSSCGRKSYSFKNVVDINVDGVEFTSSKDHSKSQGNTDIMDVDLLSVENVLDLNVDGVEFTSSKDHSKWVVSASKSKPWVCVGDINKDNAQEKRGGGTVCQKNKDVWQAYHDIVLDVQSCSGKKGRSDKIGHALTDDMNGGYWKDIGRFPRYPGVSRFFDIIGPIG